jgi:transposase-like protein
MLTWLRSATAAIASRPRSSRRRDSQAAARLMRKLLKKQGFAPKLLVTDKLRSCGPAFRPFRRRC